MAEGGAIELRLLPIRAARQTPVSELKRYPGRMDRDRGRGRRPRPGPRFMCARGETGRVEVAEAQALGFRVDAAGDDGIRPDAEGRIEIPRWRHAVQFPHPLLEQGLVVLDTPGLNAIGAGPSSPCRCCRNAHAVLFILAADTGRHPERSRGWRN